MHILTQKGKGVAFKKDLTREEASDIFLKHDNIMVIQCLTGYYTKEEKTK